MSPCSIKDTSSYKPYRDFFTVINANAAKKASCKILDIGCGNGLFLKECSRRGCNIRGIEASEDLQAVIDPKIIGHIIFKPVEAVSLHEHFDVITFWDCFEHIPKAFDILEHLRTNLEPHGIIYLRVNNNKDVFNFFAAIMLKIFPAAGKKIFKTCFGFPSHLWNFSREGMANMLKKRKWKIIYSRISDTPASRFTRNLPVVALIQCGYLVNRLIGGGKIGEYYIVPDRVNR
jgi:2-polyprenyl-3-methyl-5-hydroxy-6-metoxy-1,4-benzoquinol methylase